jgi:ubiquinone/menaquinone biosynthesis C-methylase UbiE
MDWHARFIDQARWTKSLREYLIKGIPIFKDANALEIGSGTGVIAKEFFDITHYKTYGIEIDFNRCEMSTRNYQNLIIANADGYQLPFPASSFDVVFCHYLLLWITSPIDLFKEVFRILKPNGYFLAFAEPDYPARIDSPPPLDQLGALQNQSLIDQGINPRIGRQLSSLASNSGFIDTRVGISCYEQSCGDVPEWWESEWAAIQQDLLHRVSKSKLDAYKKIDLESWQAGTRILWIPTFYLITKKPS